MSVLVVLLSMLVCYTLNQAKSGSTSFAKTENIPFLVPNINTDRSLVGTIANNVTKDQRTPDGQDKYQSIFHRLLKRHMINLV